MILQVPTREVFAEERKFWMIALWSKRKPIHAQASFLGLSMFVEHPHVW